MKKQVRAILKKHPDLRWDDAIQIVLDETQLDRCAGREVAVKPERFLAALDPTADEWTFQTFDDNKERKEENEAKWEARGRTGKKDPFAFTLHGTLASCCVFPGLSDSTRAALGIFVTVNVTDFKGRKKGNIQSVRALFSHLDAAARSRARRWRA